MRPYNAADVNNFAEDACTRATTPADHYVFYRTSNSSGTAASCAQKFAVVGLACRELAMDETVTPITRS
jgi:hypothetical protein